MDPVLLQICDQHGVFLRREAEALGYHDHAISSLVKARVWQRVRHGAYTSGERWRQLGDAERHALLARAAYRQAQTKVMLSHTSAINEWAAPLWGFDLSEAHLTRRDGRSGRRQAGVVQHRGRLVDGDAVLHRGLFVASPTRAALEITTLVGLEGAMVVIDDLVHRGLTDAERLASRFALMNHWPDTLHTDLVLRRVDGRSESVGETRLRYLCWAQRLPTPIPNYPIRDARGTVVHRVDLAWPELGVFVEFDGRIKYGKLLEADETAKDVVVREQRREELICRLTGWRCVRVVWADLDRPAETADRIRSQFRPAAVA
ncbi:type IV toxin-antitoxin system AbiEi family antitoxin domain-containing protein [Nocardioides dongxiaopingii]|uniref:type IV toxin-antitoxin system AbiEi family antitoxin domain-containing protein n=1 Tax=Nocardioides dongxiaopingii TaxID=2576036 RepID=UPI0010C765CA|nr:type IV toxin-antitoxin system AbiEi family antitoxin domain-containing protein [Nocardioides dongxiaopingii]